MNDLELNNYEYFREQDFLHWKNLTKYERECCEIVIRNFDPKYEIKKFIFQYKENGLIIVLHDKSNNLFVNLGLSMDVGRITVETDLIFVFNQQIEFRIDVYKKNKLFKDNLIVRLVDIKKSADNIKLNEHDALIQVMNKLNVLIQNLKNG